MHDIQSLCGGGKHCAGEGGKAVKFGANAPFG